MDVRGTAAFSISASAGFCLFHMLNTFIMLECVNENIHILDDYSLNCAQNTFVDLMIRFFSTKISQNNSTNF